MRGAADSGRSELAWLSYRRSDDCQAPDVAADGPKRISSGNWTAFSNNHAAEIAAIDFFVVPTVAFRLLYVLLVLSPDRRRVVHFNVTCNPSAARTVQQITEALSFDSAPKYLVRDNDGIFSREFTDRIERMQIEDTPIATLSPRQNPYVERLFGTIRR